MRLATLVILCTLTAGAQKAPRGFEFHNQIERETLRGFAERMQSLDIRFMSNGETGLMQECHRAPQSSYGVYECYDIPWWKAYCPMLKSDGSLEWKRYRGKRFFNDCVDSIAGKMVRTP